MHFFTQFGLKCTKLLPPKNLKLLEEYTAQKGFSVMFLILFTNVYLLYCNTYTYIFFSRCQKKLTVGVTDESMLKSKKLNDLIEPVEKRIAVVSQFLKGTLENKFPSGVIQQLCGPNFTQF